MSQDIQRVAIDSGGTFTDFVVLSHNGERKRFKVPSTPDDPSRAIHEGLALFGHAERPNLTRYNRSNQCTP